MRAHSHLVAILAVLVGTLAVRLLGGDGGVATGVSGARGPRSGTGATGAPEPRGPRAPAGGERDPGRIQGDGTAVHPSGHPGGPPAPAAPVRSTSAGE